ncbi:MAG: hypothetical protein ACI9SI_000970 [Polaribacter sp.]
MKENLIQSKNWSLPSKIIFRVSFSYFTLFILLLFLALFIEAPLRWFADVILNWGADFKMESTGSGDRSFDYVRFALNLLLAFFAAIAWSILDKKRASYTTLFYWFQTILRVFLCIAMILYGLAKVFKGQFADPSLELLLQPVGEMSPMGLAWTFMGHSMVYNIFLGSLEILGGLLLLYRKTSTLGSLLILGIMMNVTIMNLTYDIPVKLFSIHLVLMAFILLVANGKRVLNFFLKNEATEKLLYINYIKNKSFLKIIRFFKKATIILIPILVTLQCFINFKATEQLRSNSKIRGIWKVETFIKQNDTLAPLLTDSLRWRYLIIDYKKKAVVKKMNDTIERYSFEENTETKELIFKSSTDSVAQKFTYSISDSNELKLKGDHLNISLKRIPPSKFRLLNRKFHWVNESTYNY